MKKLLIVKLGAIGDVVLTLPAIEVIREEHPSAHITLLIGQASSPVVENNPAIDRLWVIDEKIFWNKRVLSLLGLALSLRRERFEQVFILHWSAMFHRFFQWIGVPSRWGFARDTVAPALTRSVPYKEGDLSAHDVSQYLSAVSDRFSPSEIPARMPRLILQSEELEWGRKQIALVSRPMAIAPGGGNNPKLVMPQKRWLPQRYIELGEQLIVKRSATLFVLGDASETSILEPLRLKYPDHVRILAGLISLRQSAAVIQQCHVFIGNDSGLFHLAYAVGTPTISAFGPTSPNGKMPTWHAHRLLYSRESCSPCYKHGFAPPCPYELRCMQNIPVSAVFDAVNELIPYNA